MPETEALIEDWDDAATLREFYRAMREKDPEAIAALIASRFSPDASVCWPDSFGGTVAGADRLTRRLSRAVAAETGASNLVLVDITESESHYVAEVTFDWIASPDAEPIPSSALEKWTFSDGVVKEIRAYYWDAHALAVAAAGGQQG